MEQEQSYNVTTSSNQQFTQANVLQLRLDTTTLLENIELFLRGAKIVIDRDESGNITSKNVSLGKPKANAVGVQAILNYCQIIGPHTVQGNFPSDAQGHSTMYEQYIEEVHIDLTCFLLNNMYNWGISEDDVDVIIDFIMKMIIPFMTRLIDNKERESFANTLQHKELQGIKKEERQKMGLFS